MNMVKYLWHSNDFAIKTSIYPFAVDFYKQSTSERTLIYKKIF